MVGCVIGRGRTVLGEGYHRRFGGPHAEVAALEACRRAQRRTAGATAWVTLEPCAHHGKTPPCAQALAEAGLARVVVALRDPFPEVDGRGIEALRAAGLQVEVGVEEAAARRLNAPFFKRHRDGLPWLILKWAQTLDGRIATRTGHSRWISGEPARRRVHRWRGEVDAIMVGIGTALADDPRLTARARRPPPRRARRVVVDPRLQLPPASRLVQSLAEGAPPLTIATAHAPRADAQRRAALAAAGAEVIELPPGPGRHLRLTGLLHHLAETHAASNVLVEGGAGLAGSLLAEGLVDELRVFIAPRLLGDARAVPPVRGLAPETLGAGMAFELESARRLGEDQLMVLRTRA